MSCRRILLAVCLLAILFAVPAAAKGPTGGTSSGACPSAKDLKSFVAASNVGADFTNSGSITTYKFYSFTNENPQDGVPGLVKYCVYPSPPQSPTSIHVDAKGGDGETWLSRKDTKNFSFVRPSGNPSNIPLDGKTTVMGTATWTTLPTDQTILLHIADATVCSSLYPSNTTGTCFVLPGTNPLSCTDGDDSVAYNANPFGVLHCPKFALGFESNSTNEFGDRVTLAKDTAGTKLEVVFASYACQTSGHWNTSDCVSADPPGTYTLPTGHDFTAKIYSVTDCSGTPCIDQTLGTATLDGATTPIPFRPSADTTGPCAGTGQFFDPLAPVGSQCKNAKAFFLDFTFSNLNLVSGTTYVWTVAFDTTHSGYDPIGTQSCNSSLPGCPYDALNVGYAFYPGPPPAPYSGIDPNPAEAFQSLLSSPTLHSTTTWQDSGEEGRPLGEITIP